MISISTRSISGVLLQQLDSGAAVFGVHHIQIVILQQAGEREDVANVVVHHQNLFADKRDIGLAQLFQNPALVRREIGFGAMQQKNGFVQQPLQRVGASSRRWSARDARDPSSSVARQRRVQHKMMGGTCGPVWLWISSTSCNGPISCDLQVDHDAIQILLLHHRQRFAAGADVDDFESGAASIADDGLPLVVIARKPPAASSRRF